MVQKVVYIIGKYCFISVLLSGSRKINCLEVLPFRISHHFIQKKKAKGRPENPGVTKNQQDDGMFVFIRIMKMPDLR